MGDKQYLHHPTVLSACGISRQALRWAGYLDTVTKSPQYLGRLMAGELFRVQVTTRSALGTLKLGAGGSSHDWTYGTG